MCQASLCPHNQCNSQSARVSSALQNIVLCTLLECKILDAWNYVLFIFVSPVRTVPCTQQGLNDHLIYAVMLFEGMTRKKCRLTFFDCANSLRQACQYSIIVHVKKYWVCRGQVRFMKGVVKDGQCVSGQGLIQSFPLVSPERLSRVTGISVFSF